jgi:hypothetical protein
VNLKATLWSTILATFVGTGSASVAMATPKNQAPAQRYVCNVGYTLEECDERMLVLRRVLKKYPTDSLGEWSWVLVKSIDWKQILRVRGLDADAPAFTYLPARETFFDDALVGHESARGIELAVMWRLSIEELLDLAVRHELGHALCGERDEGQADRVAAVLLREGKRFSSCDRDFSAKNQFGRVRVRQ